MREESADMNHSFSIRKFLALTRGSVLDSLVFRASVLVTIFGNLIYLLIIYYLWKSIYASSPADVINGMTFSDTMVYLVLASALFSFMNCYIVWGMGRDFQTGQIVLDMLKPMDYQLFWFFSTSGAYVISFFFTFLPTFLVVYLVTKGGFALGMNLLFFVGSVILSVAINFSVDFFVGVICFYTQSVWGVNIMKEVIVAFLSGATIPLAFFPEKIHTFVNWLPFQAIYNTPLQILIDDSLTGMDIQQMLLKQMLWAIFMILLSRAFWLVSQKVITVNGG